MTVFFEVYQVFTLCKQFSWCSNPVMQYAAGEVQIETPSQGNPQLTTIHHRFTQQNQNFHTSSTQVIK